jgi:hypothetical protein
MDEQTARDLALTRVAFGHAAHGKHLNYTNSQRGKFNNNRRNGKHNNSRQNTHQSAEAHATGKCIVCYNCNEPGHLAPNCPKKNSNKRQPAYATQSNNAPPNEITCVAIVRPTNELTSDGNIIYASSTNPNTTLHKDKSLNLFFMNDVYVTIYFDAWDYFNEPRVSYTDIEAYIHSYPLEEEYLDFAAILNLEFPSRYPSFNTRNRRINERRIRNNISRGFDASQIFNLEKTSQRNCSC